MSSALLRGARYELNAVRDSAQLTPPPLSSRPVLLSLGTRICTVLRFDAGVDALRPFIAWAFSSGGSDLLCSSNDVLNERRGGGELVGGGGGGRFALGTCGDAEKGPPRPAQRLGAGG